MNKEINDKKEVTESFFQLLLDYDKLYSGYINSIKSVKWKRSIQYYMYSALLNIIKLHNSIENGTYKQKPLYEFDINERGKSRHIKAVNIFDRVLQHTICDEILNPVIEPYLIYDNGSTIKGKGLSFARNRLKMHLHNYWINNGNEGYILLMDFSKYFDNINHEKLLEMFKAKLDDEKFIKLIEYILSTFDIDGDNSKSIGIGSQISQISGVFYAHPIDNYCKICRGIKYYGRYMDDTYIISNSKEELLDLLYNIKIITNDLGIVINEKKTRIISLDSSFTWLHIKYRLKPNGKIIMKLSNDTISRERRKLKKLHKKFLNNEIDIVKIYNMYKSWRMSNIKFDSGNKLFNTDKLFDELFSPYINDYIINDIKEQRKSLQLNRDNIIDFYINDKI